MNHLLRAHWPVACSSRKLGTYSGNAHPRYLQGATDILVRSFIRSTSRDIIRFLDTTLLLIDAQNLSIVWKLSNMTKHNGPGNEHYSSRGCEDHLWIRLMMKNVEYANTYNNSPYLCFVHWSFMLPYTVFPQFVWSTTALEPLVSS